MHLQKPSRQKQIPGSQLTFLATDGALDEAVEALVGSTIPVPAGIGAHIFYARIKDIDGSWSSTFATIVEVIDNGTSTPPSTGLTSAEYFWNLDPGEGNGTVFFSVDGAFEESVESLFRKCMVTWSGGRWG